MKKLLVVLLAAVMVLSIAAIASAEVSTWIGGDFYFRYESVDKAWEAGRNNFFVGGITAKATKDNTWAKLWINTDTWTTLEPGPAMKYALGIDKIGGIASLSWSTKDPDICNIGQAPLWDSIDDFKSDPIFNTYDGNNSFGLVIDSDTFTVKAETVAIGAGPNMFAIEGIFKFDGGKAYVAYKGNGATWAPPGSSWCAFGDTLIDVGGEMKLGDLGLKADVYLNSLGSTAINTIVQANVSGGPWDATLNVVLPNGGGNSVFGVGGNYQLMEKLKIGAKYFSLPSPAKSIYEVYGLYNVGAFDVRLGYVNPGNGGFDGGLPNSDAYFTLGVHAGIW